MNAAQVRRLDRHYLMNTYTRPPVVFTHGKGCVLYDHRGRPYLDFLSGIGVNALGYGHPRLVRVILRQARKAVHVSNLFHHPFQGPLARKLSQWSGLERVFFTNSGTEAIEGALKLARGFAHMQADGLGPAKTRILALENSFHGRTLGALAITSTSKYRRPFAPLMPGVDFVRMNDIADLEKKFTARVCAIVLEPLQGEGGINSVSEAFYGRARQLCRKFSAALIADEIQCGLGRTGRYFAYQRFDQRPDIAVIAKPLAGGLPLGAILAKDKFSGAFRPGLHGTTFGGGPLACATALEFLNTIDEEQLLDNVRARGRELRAGLEGLAARFEFVREVRGEGLLLGLVLSVDGAPFVEQALRMGLLINCTQERVLRFLPPFVITHRHVRDFLNRLALVLTKTRKPRRTK